MPLLPHLFAATVAIFGHQDTTKNCFLLKIALNNVFVLSIGRLVPDVNL
jgi:hypothetical protein